MKKWVIGLVVLGIVAAAILAFLYGGDLLQAAAPQETAEASTEQLPVVKASSHVVADAVVVPVNSAQLSLPAGGIVADVAVQESQQVAAGQVLVRLADSRQAAAVAQAEAQLLRAQRTVLDLQAGPRPEEIAAAQAGVEAARAQLSRVEQGARPEELTAAEAALAGAQAALAKLNEGPREGELIAARADVANAEAVLQQAQALYDRVKDRADVSARPESLQLAQATNSFEAAKARLAALQEGASPADIAAARAGVRQAQAQLEVLQAPARSADVAAAQVEIRRALAQVDLLQAGTRPEAIAAAQAEVKAAEAGLEQAQAALKETELRAPFAGTVASLDAQVGELVSPGVPVVWLADLSAWRIETGDLTELSVVRVKEGAAVTISFDALPNIELAGTVLRIKEIGETKMGDITYTVVIAPNEHEPRLRWNMTASVVIEVE
jgi:HlyD family secretion protein